MNDNSCFLCGNQRASVNFTYPHYDLYKVNCEICGTYLVNRIVVEDVLENTRFDHFKPKLSAILRERNIHKKEPIAIFMQEPFPTPKFPYGTLDSIINQFPKLVSDRLDRALLNLAKLSEFPGAKVNIHGKDLPILFVDTLDSQKRGLAFHYILKQLINDLYLEGEATTPGDFVVTPKGWSKVYELEKGQNPASNQGFIAMWFNPEMNEVAKDGFEKAIEDAGFKSLRIDRKEHNNQIDDEIIAEIRRSKFVVCDFTGHRGGVYFEAGFAMGLGIPVIWTCREDHSKEIHFDTRQYNHIMWNDVSDLYVKLLNRIRATVV